MNVHLVEVRGMKRESQGQNLEMYTSKHEPGVIHSTYTLIILLSPRQTLLQVNIPLHIGVCVHEGLYPEF